MKIVRSHFFFIFKRSCSNFDGTPCMYISSPQRVPRGTFFEARGTDLNNIFRGEEEKMATLLRGDSGDHFGRILNNN
jgi:hypothetical protein